MSSAEIWVVKTQKFEGYIRKFSLRLMCKFKNFGGKNSINLGPKCIFKNFKKYLRGPIAIKAKIGGYFWICG